MRGALSQRGSNTRFSREVGLRGGLAEVWRCSVRCSIDVTPSGRPAEEDLARFDIAASAGAACSHDAGYDLQTKTNLFADRT
jgi:hypothetical protein